VRTRFCLVLALLVAGSKVAQADSLDVPSFSHGPSIQAFTVKRARAVDGTLSDWTPTFLASGAGYSFNFNVLGSTSNAGKVCPCKTAYLTIAIPVYVSYAPKDGALNVSTALTLGTANNLFSVGLGYGLIDTLNDRRSYGLLIGRTDASLLFVTINVGFNFGGGSSPGGGGSAIPAAAPAAGTPPPAMPANFFRPL